jgi:hypothetical protein
MLLPARSDLAPDRPPSPERPGNVLVWLFAGAGHSHAVHVQSREKVRPLTPSSARPGSAMRSTRLSSTATPWKCHDLGRSGPLSGNVSGFGRERPGRSTVSLGAAIPGTRPLQQGPLTSLAKM